MPGVNARGIKKCLAVVAPGILMGSLKKFIEFCPAVRSYIYMSEEHYYVDLSVKELNFIKIKFFIKNSKTYLFSETKGFLLIKI